MEKEPDRYYDWMLWKFRKEKRKQKSIEDQIVGMGAGAGGRDISKEFNIPKSNYTTIDMRDVVRHLNRIEAKIDLLLSKSDGGLK